MKTYKQLTKDQKTKAIDRCTVEIWKCITEADESYISSVFPDLKDRIIEAGKRAEANQTPWFFLEYVLDTCAEDIRALALNDAKQTLYSESNERVIANIA